MSEQRSEKTHAITVANANDIPVGQMKGFTIAGKQILIANVEGEYSATWRPAERK